MSPYNEKAGAPGMDIESDEDITSAVITVMERTTDPRLRAIMVSLVKHLHGFVRETRLTEKRVLGRGGGRQ
jgi:hypothetical protein